MVIRRSLICFETINDNKMTRNDKNLTTMNEQIGMKEDNH